MKIVVIGGTGLIGSKVAVSPLQGGHEVVAALPKAASTLPARGSKKPWPAGRWCDLSNSPSLEDKAVLEFFETSGRTF
jgi:uncharacterized protein YbjT (DUF2867 family)